MRSVSQSLSTSFFQTQKKNCPVASYRLCNLGEVGNRSKALILASYLDCHHRNLYGSGQIAKCHERHANGSFLYPCSPCFSIYTITTSDCCVCWKKSALHARISELNRQLHNFWSLIRYVCFRYFAHLRGILFSIKQGWSYKIQYGSKALNKKKQAI